MVFIVELWNVYTNESQLSLRIRVRADATVQRLEFL
jgi:hypothetical protein